MSDKQELQTTEDQSQLPAASQAGQVMEALTKSLETGKLDPDQLSKVLDAQERILDRQAKMDFAYAMADCQSKMPSILKEEYNDHTKSKFESLDALNKAIAPVYTEAGFSISFGTDTCPAPTGDESGMWIRITAEVTHRSGHSKGYHYDLPYDLAGAQGTVNKTKIHASGSTLTYGRRYLLKLIFNLITSEEVDNDGNDVVGYECITEDQIANVRALLDETDTDEYSICKHCKVESLDLLPTNKLKYVINTLEARRDNQEKT